MPKTLRKYRYKRPFGPYIMQTTMSQEMIDIMLGAGSKIRKNKKLKKQKDFRKKLAGNIAEEYAFTVDEKTFTTDDWETIAEELKWLCNLYTKLSLQAGLDRSLEVPVEKIKIDYPIWINYMKSGEWNPVHLHTGDVSCVGYLKVPQAIIDENTKAEHSKSSNTPSAGKIEFHYGEKIGFDSTGEINQAYEGEIWFFPAKLRHSVYPFKSKVERVSFSANFTLSEGYNDTTRDPATNRIPVK